MEAQYMRVYTALISTDSGIVVIEKANGLGADVEWTKIATGVYEVRCEGKFIRDNTIVTLPSIDGFALALWQDIDSWWIVNKNTAGANTDGLMDKAGIEIRIYQEQN